MTEPRITAAELEELARVHVPLAGQMGLLVDISLREGIGQITLTVESRGAKFQRASDLRFTDEDKQRETSGDLLAEYVYRMNDLELFWGDRAFVSPFAPPAGPPPAPGPGRQFR